MSRLLALGFSVGLGVAWWRHLPMELRPHAGSFTLLVLGYGLACYLAGRARRPAHTAVAVAQAQARAESAASSTAQVVVNVHGGPTLGGSSVEAQRRAAWVQAQAGEPAELVDADAPYLLGEHRPQTPPALDGLLAAEGMDGDDL